MSSAQPSPARILPFLLREPSAHPSRHLYPPMPQPETGTARERDLAIDAAQDAISSALAGDEPLCSLRRGQTLRLCAGRPALARAAATEIEKALAMEVIVRHLSGCHKRRRLQRDLAELAVQLRDACAPQPTLQPALQAGLDH